MYMPRSATPLGSQPNQQSGSYMPPSATPYQDPSQQQSGPSIFGFLGNILPSAVGVAGNIYNTVRHPIQSAENMGKLAFGEGETGMAHLMGTPNKVINQPQQMANQFNQYMANRYGGAKQIGNTLYNDPVGAAMDLSSVLDGGESTIGSLADATGDVSRVGALGRTASVMGKAADVTNPLNAVKVPMQLNGKAQEIIGNAIANNGASLPLRGLRPSPSQLTKFATNTGEDLGDFLQRNNVTGNFLDTANQRIADLQDQYDNLAKDSNTAVPIKNIAEQFKPLVQQWQQSLNPALQAKAADIKGYLVSMMHKYGNDNSFTPQQASAEDGSLDPNAFKGTVSINDVLNEKRELSNVINSPQFNSMSPEQAQLNTNLYHGLKGAINDATKDTDPNGVGVGPIGKEEQKWIALKEIAQKQGNLGRGSKPLSLTGSILSTALGGTGGMLGGIPGAALGLASGPLIDAIQSNPRVISTESKILQGTGKGISNVGKFNQSIANSSKLNALLQLIRSASSGNQNINGAQNQ